MKLTLQLKLLPTTEQAKSLLHTMKQFNAATSFASSVAFDAGVFSKPSIQKLVYYKLRERFGLSAQMAIRAIAKAADAYSTCGKKTCHRFRPTGSMCFDERILSFKGCDVVSILTLEGRQLIRYVFGEYQNQRLDRLKGQVDLVYRDGKFYLYATIDMPESPPVEVQDFVGIDMGIVNLATDSDGTFHTGEKVDRVRKRFHNTRRNLQRRRTKATKRILKRIRHREARFRRHENHVIAKRIVADAKDTGRGIAVEELTGIRDRTTVRKKQRATYSGWAFHQLRSFIEYKAKLAGVPVVAVDPRNSSRTCSQCGHCEKANRKSQESFACLHCWFSCCADLNAALILRERARAASKPASSVADAQSSRKAV